MGRSLNSVSVVVCTRNRSKLLAHACNEVLEQRLNGRSWELLIVDNLSTDDSWDVARDLAAANPDRVRAVQEPELGLSAARNAGLRAAQGDAVVFLDDDAYPVDGWLESIVDALERPDVQCAGGPVDPVFQGELPEWFLGRFLPYLSAWDLGDEVRTLVYDEYPRGANIGFRREVFEAAGGFSTDLGRKGDNLLSCEEIEVCLRIERLGGTICYVPRARVRHHVNIERLSEKWMMRRFEAQGKSEAIINRRHGGLLALFRGARLLRERLRSAASQSTATENISVRCCRRSMAGYLKAGIPALVLVSRWRPARGFEASPWTPYS